MKKHRKLLRNVVASVAGAALIALLACTTAVAAGRRLPDPRVELPLVGPSQLVLAGGCFWGMELVFSHVKGVTDVVAGYAGGDRQHANYADSSSGRYGDAEAVEINYDASRISYGELLHIFFSVAHNPTEVDRQGPDRGPQYRSEIFAANTAQAKVARAYIHQLDTTAGFARPIATQVSVGKAFFMAESWHQNYAKHHPDSFYIRFNDIPKLQALKRLLPKVYSARYADGTAATR